MFRILWHTAVHGIEHHVFTRAAAMTYTTLLAIVPTFILLHAFASFFDVLDLAAEALPLINNHLQLGLPVQDILPILEHAESISVSQLGLLGLGSLFITFVLALDNLELHFNALWGVKKARSYLRKAILSIPFLIIALLLLLIATGIFSYVQHLLKDFLTTGSFTINDSQWKWLQSLGIFVAVHGGLWFVIFIMYRTIPYTRIKLKPALIASITTVVALRFLIWGFMVFQSLLFHRMSLFYGSLAFIPLLMLFVFSVWSLILLGNSLCWRVQYWPPNVRYKRTWRDI